MVDMAKEEDDEQIHELKDILVEEVSVVDRAANKRRFILVKRDGSLVMAEAKDVKADEKTKDAKKADDEKKSDDEKKAAAKAKDEKSDDEKKSDEKKADSKKDDAKKDDDEKKAAKAADSKKDDDEKKADEKKTEKVELNDDALEQVTKQLIAKAGARMSKDRFKRFKQGVDLIMSVFNELSPMSEAGMKADGDKKVKAKKSGDSDRTPTKKSDGPDARDAVIAKLTDEVSTLTAIVKTQNERVQRIEKSRGAGNAVPPEVGSKKVEKQVSWPSDMNNPITQETVAKERWLG